MPLVVRDFRVILSAANELLDLLRVLDGGCKVLASSGRDEEVVLDASDELETACTTRFR